MKLWELTERLAQLEEIHGAHIEIYYIDGENGDAPVEVAEINNYLAGPQIVVLRRKYNNEL